jgi:hypothetical protein
MSNDTLTFDDVIESFKAETKKHEAVLRAKLQGNVTLEGQEPTAGLATKNVKVREKVEHKVRGLFEKSPGSDVWWIRYFDAHGRLRREKAGTKGMAEKLYRKRKTEALQGRKLPETLRRRETLLSELLADAAEHIRERYRGQRLGADGKDYRYVALKDALGNHPAESVTAQEIERALSRLAGERNWKPASFNRHKAFLSLAYRLGVES